MDNGIRVVYFRFYPVNTLHNECFVYLHDFFVGVFNCEAQDYASFLLLENAITEDHFANSFLLYVINYILVYSSYESISSKCSFVVVDLFAFVLSFLFYIYYIVNLCSFQSLILCFLIIRLLGLRNKYLTGKSVLLSASMESKPILFPPDEVLISNNV